MHWFNCFVSQVQTATGQTLTNVVAAAGFLLIIIATLSVIQFIINRQKRNNLYLQQEALKEDFDKQLLQSRVEVQESTLHTLSMELHDNINQLLGSAHNLLQVGFRELDKVPPTIKEASDTLLKASSDIRTLSRSFNKEWLEKFDLIENLTSEINRMNRYGKIKFHLSGIDFVTMSNQKQLLLFRIVQEAFQNCIKHAKPANIFISLLKEDLNLIITIEDDGIGIDPTLQKDGMGMMNMRQRTLLMGGSIVWKALQKGCEVRLVLPENQ